MNVIYQDEYLIAINKPAGLLVHRSAVDRHETRFAMQLLRDHIGQRVYPLHRLDKPVSGVLMFALDNNTARHMMPLFSNGSIKKIYLAVVRGYTRQSDTIEYALREQHDKMTDHLASLNKAAQPAITRYQRLATVELPHAVGRYTTARYSLLCLQPLTGRKHQLRRHMKHIYHPIIGDTTHGDGRHNQFFRDQFGCHQLLLTATQLSFMHPFLNQPITIRAPLDTAFELLAHQFDWQGIADIGYFSLGDIN